VGILDPGIDAEQKSPAITGVYWQPSVRVQTVAAQISALSNLSIITQSMVQEV